MNENIKFTIENQQCKQIDIETSGDVVSKQILKVIDLTYHLGIYSEGKNVLYCEETNTYIDEDKTLNECGVYSGSIFRVVSKEKYDSLKLKNENNNSYPEFIRNTRIKTVLSQEKIIIKNPSPKPQKSTNSILLSLLPIMVMLVITIVVRSFTKSNNIYIIFTVCSMSIGIMTSFISYMQGQGKYNKAIKNRRESYERYITDLKQKIIEARKKEKEDLEQLYYSANQEYELVCSFSSELFDRRPGDEDFLYVCVGNAVLPAKRQLEYRMTEKLEVTDVLEKIPSQLQTAYKYIKNVPLAFSLLECSAVGIVGKKDSRDYMFKRMLMDICTRQFSSDVKLYFFGTQEQEELAKNIRLLPHLQNKEQAMRNIAIDKESRNNLMDYLLRRITEKEIEKVNVPIDVIFVYDEGEIKQHPIAKYIDCGKDVGVCFIFFQENMEVLPQGCDKIIEVTEEQGTLWDSRNKEERQSFYYEKISDEIIKEIAEKLAPVYAKEVNLNNLIPNKVTLYEMLGIRKIEEYPVLSYWKNVQVSDGLSVSLGWGTKNKDVCLDIHEKAHGPHGLVAGTTGSGKSELLQSYIISMALKYSPSVVGFLLIDFKGGGMANQFQKLPHLLGTITNIDEYAVERSLKSIKAEVLKRQQIFSKNGVNKIDDYIQKRMENEHMDVIPHLVIIVDEFAELKAQQPEFMNELISIARIGRSLGVHLILATQKPAGQVSEQIWSNSTFKLCLKVQSASDSKEVLKTPLAAEIKETGRCYLQVGNNEIFELFQSAYSGEKIRENSVIEQNYSIYELGVSGEHIPIYEQKSGEENIKMCSQLEAAVNYLNKLVEENNIEVAPSICLPELEEMIYMESDTRVSETVAIDIGIMDEPERQQQVRKTVLLGEVNTIILGASQMGKTTFLMTIIKGIAQQYTVREVQFYILDFASMFLKNFEQLPHCGGVVCTNEDEKVKNLFKMLFNEIEYRKDKLQRAGVSSLSAYKKAGYEDLPNIILIIDNFTALAEWYLQEDDILLQLCRDGLSVGISIVMTNGQTSGLNFKYLANFDEKISLYCVNEAEYSNLFGKSKLWLPKIPGRCLVEQNDEITQCQIYQPFKGNIEIERKDNILEFVETIAKKEKERAKQIPQVPEKLTLNYLQQQFKARKSEYEIYLGMDYQSVYPVALDLCKVGTIPLVGGTEEKRKEIVVSICNQLEQVNDGVEIVVLDNILQSFRCLEQFASVKEYIIEENEMASYIRNLEHRLEKRYMAYAEERSNLSKEPLLVTIVGGSEEIDYISGERNLSKLYQTITGKYGMLKVCFIFADVPNRPIPYSAGEVYKSIKEKSGFIALENINNINITEVPISVAKRFRKKLGQDDGYYITKDGVVKLKTIIDENILKSSIVNENSGIL